MDFIAHHLQPICSDDKDSLLMAVLVFLAAGTLAFSPMAFVRVRGSVKRRTARIMDEGERRQSESARCAIPAAKAVTRLHRIHHQALCRQPTTTT